MSVISRVVLAGLACVSVVSVQVAPAPARAQTAAGGDGPNGDTRGRFFHASKCVVSLGFGGGCDKDAPAPKAADRPAASAAAVDTSTRGQFFHASKCVVSLGFVGGCDKDAPTASPAAAGHRADAAPAAAPAAPDTSTRGQFLQAAKCVTSLGLRSGCNDKK